jgi:hypothetical protein
MICWSTNPERQKGGLESSVVDMGSKVDEILRAPDRGSVVRIIKDASVSMEQYLRFR